MVRRPKHCTEETNVAHDLLNEKFRERHGNVAKVQEDMGVNKNFWSKCRKEQRLDYGALIAALRSLEIEPRDFFNELWPGDDVTASRKTWLRRPAGELGECLAFAPENPEIEPKLLALIEKADELRYEDCEAGLALLYSRATEIPRSLGSKWLAVAGSCLRMAGDLTEAELCLDAALVLAPDDGARANIFQRQSYIAKNQGDFDQALGLVERAAGIFFRVGDMERLGQVLVDQGELLWHWGQTDAAIDTVERAFDLLSETDTQYRCAANLALAAGYQRKKQLKRAYRHVNEARRLAHNRHLQAGSMSTAAMILEAAGRFREAAAVHQSAFEILVEPLEQLLCLAYTVRAKAAAGQYSEAAVLASSASCLMGSVRGRVAQAALLDLQRLSASDCAKATVVRRVVQTVERLQQERGDSLGERVARARRRSGLDRPTVARQMGVSAESLIKMESGRIPGGKYAESVSVWLNDNSPAVQMSSLALSRQDPLADTSGRP